MDISILGFKFNLEILILIGVVYLILVGHTLYSCCNCRGLLEGLDNMINTDASGNIPDSLKNLPTQSQSGSGSETSPSPAGGLIARAAKNGSSNTNSVAGKEGFVGANTNFGQSSPYDISYDKELDTSSWSRPDMTVQPGKPLSAGVKQFLEREPQPVPLPEGQMLMFATTPFKPECCPNTYSNSTGCACMTGQQYNWLQMRGGNNVPYSEY